MHNGNTVQPFAGFFKEPVGRFILLGVASNWKLSIIQAPVNLQATIKNAVVFFKTSKKKFSFKNFYLEVLKNTTAFTKDDSKLLFEMKKKVFINY